MVRSLAPWSRVLRERWLYVLMIISVAGTLIAYQRSTPYEVDLAAQHHPIFMEGFYAPEPSPGGAVRWTGQRADVRLPNMWPGQAVRLTLVASAPRQDDPASMGGPVQTQVLVNGQQLATLEMSGGPTEYVLDVPADAIGRSGNLYLTLLTPVFVPPSDLRSLGLLVARVYAEPASHGPFLPPLETLLSLALLTGAAYLWARRLGAGRRAAVIISGTLGAAGIAGLLLARPWTTPISNRLLLLVAVAMAGAELIHRLSGRRMDARAYRIAAAILLGAFAVRLGLAHTPGDHDNFLAFKMMIDNVTRNGIANAYEIDPVIGAYPPVHHYLFALIGNLYRTFVDPAFFVDSRRLNFVMKLPTIVLDMLIVVTIMVYALRRGDVRRALWAGGVYAFNPGIIYTTAYNAQLGDPLYSLLVAVAVAGLLSGGAGTTGAFTALAALTKPQASAFLPFLAIGALRHLRGKKLLRTLAFGAGAALIVLAPFLFAGTLGHMIHTISTTVGHGPRIASHAFNIWWLRGWGNAWEILDTERAFGLVSYRTVGLLLFFGAAYGLIAWRTWKARGAEELAMIAPYAGLAFFMLPTEIHENYLFPTFALLALAAVHDRRAWAVGGVLTITWFVNLISIDQTLMRPLLAFWPDLAAIKFPVEVVMACINVGVLLIWSYWLFRMGRPAHARRAKSSVQ